MSNKGFSTIRQSKFSVTPLLHERTIYMCARGGVARIGSRVLLEQWEVFEDECHDAPVVGKSPPYPSHNVFPG